MLGPRYILGFLILGLVSGTLIDCPPSPAPQVTCSTLKRNTVLSGQIPIVEYDMPAPVFQSCSKSFRGKQTNIVFQAVAHESGADVQKLARNIFNAELGSINEVYRGLHKWFEDDLVGNLFSHLRQLFVKWVSEAWHDSRALIRHQLGLPAYQTVRTVAIRDSGTRFQQ